MTSRIAALSLGLIAAIAIFLFLNFDWTAVLASLANAGKASIGAALTDSWARRAWTICGVVSAFAVVTLVAALIGGLIETLAARARIGALRYDPALADVWSAADWRSAFAGTAVAGRAEAMIAATLPAKGAIARRIVVDTQLLTGMDQFWLDRLALARIVSPLPSLIVGLSAAAALFAYGDGEHWDAVLAAGASGWIVIRATDYLVRLGLSAAVASALDSATATLRPLISSRMLAAPIWSDAEATIAETTPSRDTAPGVGGPSREQAVDAALPEIRASIERLLASPPGGPGRSAPP